MELRITRPGFMQGIAALAESDAPTPHLPSIERWRRGDRTERYNPNRDASRLEMRSYVCGQCHVEYYCAANDVLSFPWANGLEMEQLERHWEETVFPDGTPFFDYKHGETGAPIFKVQHPEFELWSQGIHARSGVSCADCHMPYLREGAMKISDHQVRSPLLQVDKSCQVCHRYSEEEIKERVFTIQDRTKDLMDRGLDALIALIADIDQAARAGATDDQLAEARRLQRKAQYRIDFINAENSMGFHAPQEAARILAEAIDYAQQGRLAVAQLRPIQQAADR